MHATDTVVLEVLKQPGYRSWQQPLFAGVQVDMASGRPQIDQRTVLRVAAVLFGILVLRWLLAGSPDDATAAAAVAGKAAGGSHDQPQPGAAQRLRRAGAETAHERRRQMQRCPRDTHPSTELYLETIHRCGWGSRERLCNLLACAGAVRYVWSSHFTRLEWGARRCLREPRGGCLPHSGVACRHPAKGRGPRTALSGWWRVTVAQSEHASRSRARIFAWRGRP